ncbi:MAG TPA: hypothetical protein VGR56_09805, partial [Nitrososphaerales archaeon]|nr:hypothetical protein [Nitrososphaerales archaeon]
MPKSRREKLSVLIGLEVLTEGIAFDTGDLKKHGFSHNMLTRVLGSLRQSGVLERVNSRKYLFADSFSRILKEDVLGKTPRSGLMQFPTMAVFDMCGIETWTERDLDNFVRRL